MRILFASCNPYFPQNFGGIEANLDNLCCGLVARGHDVTVLAGLAPNGWTTIRSRTITRLFGLARSAERYNGYRLFRDWDLTAATASIVKSIEPDVVVGHGGAQLDIFFRSGVDGVPTAAHLHGMPPLARIREVYERGVKNFIFCSRFLKEKALELLPPDSTIHTSVIYNAFDPDRYRAKITGTDVTFINPVVEKGVQLAEHLAHALPDKTFLFVKAWRLDPQIEARIRAIPNVAVSEPVLDMRVIYQRTRVLILPSQVEEGSGRVVTEAQINGIPVVASDLGGVRETIGSGGVLLSPTDINAWVEAVGTLLNNEARWQRVSEAAREHIRSGMFSYTKILDDYEKILADMAMHRQSIPKTKRD